MQQKAIGLSIILGFLSIELLGLHAGGLVSAGYLAFYLEQPYRLASTIALAVATCLLTKLLQKFVIIYGSRRFMVTVLLSMLGTWLFEMSAYSLHMVPQDMRIIGYIIPGLMANDMCKQGIFKTLGMTLLLAVIIRLILMTGI
ncbi:MAG: poly-gamma-glutamate biosynthesis protein PgsC [Clostridia bacterium]